jgi:hypothetical protein
MEEQGEPAASGGKRAAGAVREESTLDTSGPDQGYQKVPHRSATGTGLGNQAQDCNFN